MMTIDFTSIAALLASICVVFFVVQMSVMCGFYSRIHRHFRKDAGTDPVEYPPLSVIVVTKDTGELLHDSLTAILEQDYPAFEVIVVNDLSAGEDELILKRLANIYPNLYHTFIPETARYVSRKKLGVAMGIRASHYEWVVVTSPYARPESKEWLRSLAREMTPETDIVLGYSNYVYGKGMFALRVRTDAFFRSLRYLGMALAGHPYMGLGHNLAYRKRAYLEHKGFSSHLQLQRGEDDLLVNAIADRYNTRVARGKESIVRLPLPVSRKSWREEMLGSVLTGRFYQGVAPLLNALETWTCFLFHLGCAVAFAVGLVSGQWIWAGMAAGLWLVRLLAVMHIWYHTAWDLGEKFGVFLPIFDVLRPWWSLAHHIRFWFCRKDAFLRK